MNNFTKNENYIINENKPKFNQILESNESNLFTQENQEEISNEQLEENFENSIRDFSEKQINLEETSNSETIELEDANTTNCLALTIKKEYRLVAVKNVFLHTLRITWKVIVSAVTLNFLKFLF